MDLAGDLEQLELDGLGVDCRPGKRLVSPVAADTVTESPGRTSRIRLRR